MTVMQLPERRIIAVDPYEGGYWMNVACSSDEDFEQLPDIVEHNGKLYAKGPRRGVTGCVGYLNSFPLRHARFVTDRV